MLRLALPLLLGLVLASPARAESLRAPVDADVWRLVDGGGSDGPRRVGWVPTQLGGTLVAAAGVVGGLFGVLALAEGTPSPPPLVMVGAVLMTGAVMLPVSALVFLGEGVVTGAENRWWLGTLVAWLVPSLAACVLGTLSGSWNQVLPATVIASGLLAGALGQFVAFGSPAGVWASEP